MKYRVDVSVQTSLPAGRVMVIGDASGASAAGQANTNGLHGEVYSQSAGVAEHLPSETVTFQIFSFAVGADAAAVVSR